MSGLAKADSAEALRAMIAEGTLRPGVFPDSVCEVVPELFFEPANEDELARVLKHAGKTGMQVVPRGGGTKLDWGTAPRAIDLMISTAKLNRILEHAPGDMTITVEAGATIAQIQTALSWYRQRLAIDPLWSANATVGGVIATNDSGALRLRYGGVRDLIIGITVVLPDGTIAKSGGKVVKNVAGYDLPKLMCGGLGTLGMITKAVFRLHPMPESSRTLTLSFPDCETANQFLLSVTDSIAVPTGLQIRIGASGMAAVDVRMEGIAASIAAQSELVFKLASGAKPCETEGNSWQASEQLWSADNQVSILKLSTLPALLGATAGFIREALGGRPKWSLVMQSTGLSWLRIDTPDRVQIVQLVSKLRSFLSPTGGTAVLLKAPQALRNEIDVWGDPGNALPLMRRIKKQFDPNGILNSGRFVGGI